MRMPKVILEETLATLEDQLYLADSVVAVLPENTQKMLSECEKRINVLVEEFDNFGLMALTMAYLHKNKENVEMALSDYDSDEP